MVKKLDEFLLTKLGTFVKSRLFKFLPAFQHMMVQNGSFVSFLEMEKCRAGGLFLITFSFTIQMTYLSPLVKKVPLITKVLLSFCFNVFLWHKAYSKVWNRRRP